jgi:hypothetical protein
MQKVEGSNPFSRFARSGSRGPQTVFKLSAPDVGRAAGRALLGPFR